MLWRWKGSPGLECGNSGDLSMEELGSWKKKGGAAIRPDSIAGNTRSAGQPTLRILDLPFEKEYALLIQLPCGNS